MKTVNEAIDKAIKISKNNGREMFVVYSPGELDIPGNDYHVANDLDIDTFYNGCEVLYSTDDEEF